MTRKLNVLSHEISTFTKDGIEYIGITDIARYKSPDRTGIVIGNWLRNRNTLEFLGIWEKINNSDFNVIEFDDIKSTAGLNSFTLTANEWISRTSAIGIISKPGRYGGTYAQKDIAFEFASWVSVEFKLYLIKEFQRLKEKEHERLGWDIKRELARVNYRIHTAAIKENLVPAALTPFQASFMYADEADVLNVALFGMTAKDWRDTNPDLKGNIRDHAGTAQLVCLANLENLNAHFIQQGMAQAERIRQLNQIAIRQMTILSTQGLSDISQP